MRAHAQTGDQARAQSRRAVMKPGVCRPGARKDRSSVRSPKVKGEERGLKSLNPTTRHRTASQKGGEEEWNGSLPREPELPRCTCRSRDLRFTWWGRPCRGTCVESQACDIPGANGRRKHKTTLLGSSPFSVHETLSGKTKP